MLRVIYAGNPECSAKTLRALTYAVQENFGVDNYSHRNVSVKDALEIIKMLDLKEITPTWDDGNQNHARKYVSRNSSGNWSR